MYTPHELMQFAIDEGKKGLGFVHPNPPVGAVIVSNTGELIAQGRHSFFGGPHAEIDALNALKDPQSLRGATMYVTLEPCAHEGKTPSCAKTLAQLPLKKVVYGIKDPNPLVSGQGVKILEAAGIEVVLFADLKNELKELCEIFLWNMNKKKTFVALKAATSKDGFLGRAGKDPWITNSLSREYVHQLRAQYEAVIIGVETFLTDNPSLNIRSKIHGEKENIAIVLDTEGRGLSRLRDSNLSKVRPINKIIWCVGESWTPENGGCVLPEGQIIKLPLSNITNSLDLEVLLNRLYEKNILSAFVEGGAKVYESFLRQNLVNRIFRFVAPVALDEEGHTLWLSETQSSLIENFEFKSVENLKLNGDQLFSGRKN